MLSADKIDCPHCPSVSMVVRMINGISTHVFHCPKCNRIWHPGTSNRLPKEETALFWATNRKPTPYIVAVAFVKTPDYVGTDSVIKSIQTFYQTRARELVRINNGLLCDPLLRGLCAAFKSIDDCLSFILTLRASAVTADISLCACVNAGTVTAEEKLSGRPLETTCDLLGELGEAPGIWVTTRVFQDVPSNEVQESLEWEPHSIREGSAEQAILYKLKEGSRSLIVRSVVAKIRQLGGLEKTFSKAKAEFIDFLSKIKTELIGLSVSPPICADKGPSRGGVRPYGREILYNHNDIEILIARWQEGVECAPHNHAGGKGWVIVLAGEFHETHWMIASGKYIKNRDGKRVSEHDGIPIYTVTSDVLHSMHCSTDGVSLHFYIPETAQTSEKLGMIIVDPSVHVAYEIHDICEYGKGGAWFPPDLCSVNRIWEADDLPPNLLKQWRCKVSSRANSMKTGYIPIIVLTALPLEQHAVLRSLDHEYDSKLGITVAPLAIEDRLFKVHVITSGAGNLKAATTLAPLLAKIKPKLAFFCGVCGNIKDNGIGDVIYSTKVYYIEGGKEESGGSFNFRPAAKETSSKLVQLAHRVAASTWAADLTTFSGDIPKASPGVVASGEKVLTSTDPDAIQYQRIKHGFNDSQVIEMEGYGFMEACHESGIYDAMVIRGVSDLMVGKSASDHGGSQPMAAKNASAFLFALLDAYASSLGPIPKK